MQQHLSERQTPVKGGNRCILETCERFGGQARTALPTILLPVNKSAPVKLTWQCQITDTTRLNCSVEHLHNHHQPKWENKSSDH